MNRLLAIAAREYTSTVLTRGFLLGIALTPIIILVVVFATRWLARQDSPTVHGTVAVLDRSGLAQAGIAEAFSPARALADQQARLAKVEQAVSQSAKALNVPPDDAARAAPMVRAGVAAAMKGPDLRVEILDRAADPDPIRAALATVEIRGRDQSDGNQQPPIIALAVIPEASVVGTPAVANAEAGPAGAAGPAAAVYPPFDLFVAPKLDFEIQRDIRTRIAEAITNARIVNDARVKAAGFDVASLRTLLAQPQADTQAVTTSGTQQTAGPARMLIAGGFMLLLMLAVFTSGQYLLTTLIEEKSSRVMEVLLSAASPMQLMCGKILGQMAVGLTILVVYSGAGVGALMAFSLMYLLDPSALVYLLIYFALAYATIAAMMAAVGSAVSDLREAQTLMTPIMMLVMLPWLLWAPISRAPNSTLATALSFTPGISPFAMAIRLSGSEPIPGWQIPASIAVGLLSAAAALWACAKIFRIGVLLYGKPPSFGTMIKWIRMA